MCGMHGGDIYRNQVDMDFSVNINPLGMPEGVEEALREAVGHCLEYPDISAEKLKNAVADALAVKEEQLLFGNGASEIFMGIVHAVQPKKVLIPIPSFYGYEYAAEAVGGSIVYFSLREEREFLPDEALYEALTEDIDLVYLANPNNPTGKRMSREYVRKLLTVCREKGILVVLDECFIEFCGNGCSMLAETENFDNLLLVRAFTKIYAIPGVRLGYLVCSNRILLQRISHQLPEWNLSVFAQRAGVACVGQTTFVAETVAYVARERQFLEEGLHRLGLRVFSGEANYILVYSRRPLYEELLKQGILIRDCANFKGLSKGYYRIAVKQREENEKLLKAIGACVEKNRTFITGRN